MFTAGSLSFPTTFYRCKTNNCTFSICIWCVINNVKRTFQWFVVYLDAVYNDGWSTDKALLLNIIKWNERRKHLLIKVTLELEIYLHANTHCWTLTLLYLPMPEEYICSHCYHVRQCNWARILEDWYYIIKPWGMYSNKLFWLCWINHRQWGS